MIATNCIKNNKIFPQFEKIRFVSKETYDNWFRSHPQPGDIILVNKGTPGLTALVPNPINFCFAQDMVAIHADDSKINPLYLFAFLRSPFFLGQVKANIVGTLIPHFKKRDFDKILIPIPPNPLQKFIGELHYNLSLKIELNEQINEIIEDIALKTFNSWFIDFEPFQDGEFEETELGMIPKGWEIDQLQNFVDVTMGLSPPGESYNEIEEGMPFFQGTRDFGTRYPIKRVYTTQPKQIANYNDVLLSVRAPVGSLNIAIEHCCIGRGLAALRMKQNHGGFLYYLLKSQGYKFEMASGGTVFSAIRKTDIENFKFIKPPQKFIAQFNQFVESLDKKFEINIKENDILQKIIDSLLPQLICGRLQLPKS